MDNPKERGDATEAAVMNYLITNGYSVSIPFGDNDKYDLILDDGDDLSRIQCKTAWKNKENTIRFNTHSQTTRSGEYHESTYHGEVDVLIARYPERETMYWIPIEDATEQKMELRFDGKINHPSINWASDYRIENVL